MNKFIHTTDISKFKMCKRHFDYSVNQNIVKKGADTGYFWFGTGMHKVLASFYALGGHETGVTIKQMKGFWQEYLKEFFEPMTEQAIVAREKDNELAYAMIEQYWHFSKIADKNWEIIDVEKELRTPIPSTNYTLVSTIDLLVKNKLNGNIYLVDHKNFERFSDPEYLEFDHQMTAYIWAARMNGINVNHAIYNMLRKKIPAEPQILKSGGISKNKSIDTTYEKYMQAITRMGEDVREYAEILEQLKNNRFNLRETVIRTRKNLEIFERDLIHAVNDIENTKHWYPSPTVDCVYKCSYKSLCKCELDGGNVDLIKSLEYKEGEGRNIWIDKE